MLCIPLLFPLSHTNQSSLTVVHRSRLTTIIQDIRMMDEPEQVTLCGRYGVWYGEKFLRRRSNKEPVEVRLPHKIISMGLNFSRPLENTTSLIKNTRRVQQILLLRGRVGGMSNMYVFLRPFYFYYVLLQSLPSLEALFRIPCCLMDNQPLKTGSNTRATNLLRDPHGLSLQTLTYWKSIVSSKVTTSKLSPLAWND